MTLTFKPVVEETTTLEEDVQIAERAVIPRQDVAVVEESRALSPVDQVMGMIAAASRDPTVDVAKMRELFSLQKDLMTMQAERQFNEAFHRLQQKMPRIKRNGVVEYKNKQTGQMEKTFNFAKWEDMDTVIRPLMESEGFTLSFDSTPRQGDGGGLIVTGTLSHVGGHRRSASIPVPLDTSGGKNNLQGYGSSLSYGKRYTTTALLNIITEGEDDDGDRGGRKYLTEDQIERIKRGTDVTNTDPREVFAMLDYEVHEFSEINEKDFQKLINALISRKREQDTFK